MQLRSQPQPWSSVRVVVQEADALDPALFRLPDLAEFPNFTRIVEP